METPLRRIIWNKKDVTYTIPLLCKLPSLTFRLREIEHQRVQTGMSFDDPDQEGTGPNGDSSDEGGEDRKWISPEQVKIKCIQGKRKERCLFDLIKSNHF